MFETLYRLNDRCKTPQKKLRTFAEEKNAGRFIEHLIRLGLKTYRTENQSVTIENRKVPYFSNSIPHSVSDWRKF